MQQLVMILLEQNRIEDLKRAVSDQNYQEQSMEEYGIAKEENV